MKEFDLKSVCWQKIRIPYLSNANDIFYWSRSYSFPYMNIFPIFLFPNCRVGRLAQTEMGFRLVSLINSWITPLDLGPHQILYKLSQMLPQFVSMITTDYKFSLTSYLKVVLSSGDFSHMWTHNQRILQVILVESADFTVVCSQRGDSFKDTKEFLSWHVMRKRSWTKRCKARLSKNNS